jgi:hypothetical protein
MVNNSTNINKTNNHISPKESLNSDGQQFHQYQQKEEFTSHLKSLNIKNPGPGLGKAQHCGGI